MMAREKPLGCLDELALLVHIDGKCRLHEAPRGSQPYLDEHQAVVIPHDQVDFAVPAAEITADRLKPSLAQVSKRYLLAFAA